MSSFGVGGTNAHVVLKAAAQPLDSGGHVWLVAIADSAGRVADLQMAWDVLRRPEMCSECSEEWPREPREGQLEQETRRGGHLMTLAQLSQSQLLLCHFAHEQTSFLVAGPPGIFQQADQARESPSTSGRSNASENGGKKEPRGVHLGAAHQTAGCCTSN